MIKCFIDFGIDINCNDYDRRTALHLAVSHKLASVIKLLVQLGADKDIKDRWGKTAVCYTTDKPTKDILHGDDGYESEIELEIPSPSFMLKCKKTEIESREMIAAVSSGDIGEVRRLIGKNCAVN
mgnify:CR=1 FL=1